MPFCLCTPGKGRGLSHISKGNPCNHVSNPVTQLADTLHRKHVVVTSSLRRLTVKVYSVGLGGPRCKVAGILQVHSNLCRDARLSVQR